VGSLSVRISQANVDKQNHRVQGRKPIHKYPIPMWRMVAETMTCLPESTVRTDSPLTPARAVSLPRWLPCGWVWDWHAGVVVALQASACVLHDEHVDMNTMPLTDTMMGTWPWPLDASNRLHILT
jgi:hypothetical protein